MRRISFSFQACHFLFLSASLREQIVKGFFFEAFCLPTSYFCSLRVDWFVTWWPAGDSLQGTLWKGSDSSGGTSFIAGQ